MCAENVELKALYEEFKKVAAELEEVLKDLEWRKPDVEMEIKKLKELEAKAKAGEDVDVSSQRIIVRVAKAVLNDKIEQANALEKRMNELKAKIEELSRSPETKPEAKESGEAVQKEA